MHHLVVHRAANCLGRAADVDHQLGDALDVLHRQARVHTAFKAVPSIGREIEAARTPRHCLGPPERSFDVDVFCVVGNGSGITAHDPGERLHLAVIGNHADFFIHRDGIAVEQLELLARLAPAHVKAAVDLVEVKNVRWTAQLEHHVVGNIHQGRHAPLTATGQAIQHPLRRGGAGVHIAHDAARETTAQIRRTDLHRQLVGQLGWHSWEHWLLERSPRQRRHFAGNAVNAQAMREIGRELEGEQRVVQIQVGTNVLPHGRCSIQLQQATMVFRQFELTGRAQHALALHTAQLAHLDEEGLAIVTGWQLGTHQGARHLDADTGVGRAANDVQQGALPHIDLAHAQAIGVRMLHSFLDLAHDDFGEGRRHGTQFFDLQPCHGQGVGQLLRRQRWIAEFAQPGLRKLHSGILWRCS